MDLVSKDGQRVQAKLASVPEEERTKLQRTSTCEDKPSAPPPKLTDNLTPSLIAGFVHGVIVMMSFGSFAIVIFGQSEHVELRNALALGISQQVLSASVLIGLLTFTGFFPFTMGGPTPPAALLIADVVRSVVDNVSDPNKKVPTALLTIALVSVLMGLMLIGISVTKTSVYALQLPYPVLCGFLGSVGVLLMRNSFGILLNLKLKWCFIPADWDKAKQLDAGTAILQLVLGVTVALLLLQGVPRLRAKASKRAGLLVLPTLFLLPLVAFYAAVVGGGLDMGIDSELRSTNPPYLSKASEWTWAPKDFFINFWDVPHWDIGAIFSAESILRMLISAFLCVIAALINMAGIEANAPQKSSLNLDKEFMSLGRANLLVGILGGHPGHHVAAFTLPMKKDGGTSKVAPWTASVIWFLAFITAAPLSAVIPRFFFGGCFLQVGFGLARTFLWDNRGGLDRISVAIALCTVVVAVFTDLNIASGAGFMLVAINFVRLSMNVQVVRAVERADIKRAPRYRTGKELQALKIHGHKIMVLYLDGYLFWGTVDEITGAFEDLIDGSEDDPEVIYVDLRYVTGIELSVINTFKKLVRLAGGIGISIKLCSLPGEDVIGPGLRKLMSSLPFACAEDLCTLIERGEDRLLEQWAMRSPAKAYATRRLSRSVIPVSADLARRNEGPSAYWASTCFRRWRAAVTEKQQQCKLARTAAKHEQLMDMVEETKASYGIRWEAISGELVVGQTFLSAWRAEQLVRRALVNHQEIRTYASASAQYTSPLGEDRGGQEASVEADVLARAYISQRAMICRSPHELRANQFSRRELAAEFNIKKIILIPTADGVIELGTIAGGDEGTGGTEELSVDPARLLSVAHLKTVFEAPRSEDHMKMEEAASARTLGEKLSWNLLLAIAKLGSLRRLSKESPILATPDGSLLGGDVATDIYLVLQGTFGTFRADPNSGEKSLMLKSPPGAIIGADDVWAMRPRSVQLECLTEDGEVVALSRSALKKLELNNTPFSGPPETEEFITFMKREMSLNISVMESTFTNPEM